MFFLLFSIPAVGADFGRVMDIGEGKEAPPSENSGSARASKIAIAHGDFLEGRLKRRLTARRCFPVGWLEHDEADCMDEVMKRLKWDA